MSKFAKQPIIVPKEVILMTQLKVSAGIWFLGATSDRFVKQGYRPDTTIEERFKLAAAVPGVSGLEMHYPAEITGFHYDEIKPV